MIRPLLNAVVLTALAGLLPITASQTIAADPASPWVALQDGEVPKRATQAGSLSKGGQAQYICRTEYEGSTYVVDSRRGDAT